VYGEHQRSLKLILTAFFTALTAMGAFVKIPFYPVPFTLQTLFAASAAVVLPPIWAATSQMLYLSLGLAGMPVFANGGGMAYILQPTFGYLVSLPFMSFFLAKSLRVFASKSDIFYWFIFAAAQCFVLLFGAAWLWANLNWVMKKGATPINILMVGIVIFLPSALFKALVLLWFKKRCAGFFIYINRCH